MKKTNLMKQKIILMAKEGRAWEYNRQLLSFKSNTNISIKRLVD
jgi:hypothetical protein